MIQAVILAGGLGTRLRPLTDRIPKVLVEVNGVPFLDHLLHMLKRRGFEKVLICSGHLGEQIIAHVGDGSAFDLDVKHSLEVEPRGTGGGLVYARALLEEEFFVLNGDTYLDVDYTAAEKVFHERGKDALMVVYTGAEIPEAVQNVEVNEADDIIAYAAEEKRGTATFVNGGVLALKKSVLDLSSAEKVFSLEQIIFPQLIKTARFTAYRTDTRYYDIGTMERIKAFEQHLKENQ